MSNLHQRALQVSALVQFQVPFSNTLVLKGNKAVRISCFCCKPAQAELGYVDSVQSGNKHLCLVWGLISMRRTLSC